MMRKKKIQIQQTRASKLGPIPLILQRIREEKEKTLKNPEPRNLLDRLNTKGVKARKMEIDLILKVIGNDCNLRCKYCYYSKQKRAQKKVMNSGVLEQIILEVCKYDAFKEIRFFWHEGEPLLAGISFYEKAIRLQERLKKSGQTIVNHIQTNGILIDRKWTEFFKEKEISLGIGLSLDGPQEYHDYCRQYPDGKGSFNKVMEGIVILKENELKFGIISVITNRSAKVPREIFDFFVSQQLTNTISFIPSIGVETENGISFENSVQPSLYVDFLIEIFEFWLTQDSSDLKIFPLESIVRAFLRFPQEDCRFGGGCEKRLVIDYNGDIFPCSTYGYGDFFKFGNIREGIDSIFKFGFFQKNREHLEEIKRKCSGCRWYKICQAGCPHHHYLGKGDNIFCRDFQRLFQHIQKTLKEYQLVS